MEKFSDELNEKTIHDLPDCPKCGYILRETPCPICAERANNEAQEARLARDRDILRLGGLKAYETFTCANYSDKGRLEACAGYPDINLFIFGPAGVGKTHIGTAIIRQYPNGTIIKPQHIYRKCRGLKNGSEEQAAIDRFINWPYLMIDDIGVDKKTEFSFSILYEILDGRDMNKKNGLIITSNLSIPALAERLGDDRIPSRISGLCKIVEISGNDKRIRK